MGGLGVQYACVHFRRKPIEFPAAVLGRAQAEEAHLDQQDGRNPHRCPVEHQPATPLPRGGRVVGCACHGGRVGLEPLEEFGSRPTPPALHLDIIGSGLHSATHSTRDLQVLTARSGGPTLGRICARGPVSQAPRVNSLSPGPRVTSSRWAGPGNRNGHSCPVPHESAEGDCTWLRGRFGRVRRS